MNIDFLKGQRVRETHQRNNFAVDFLGFFRCGTTALRHEMTRCLLRLIRRSKKWRSGMAGRHLRRNFISTSIAVVWPAGIVIKPPQCAGRSPDARACPSARPASRVRPATVRTGTLLPDAAPAARPRHRSRGRCAVSDSRVMRPSLSSSSALHARARIRLATARLTCTLSIAVRAATSRADRPGVCPAPPSRAIRER